MFVDRLDAARKLTEKLPPQAKDLDIVLAIPRGAVEIGLVLAQHLGLPLDLLHVAKIGTPGQEELALGAVAADGTAWYNEGLVSQLNTSPAQLNNLKEDTLARLQQRMYRYRPPLSLESIRGKGVLLVDDGVATGATLLAAAKVVKTAGAATLGIAVPVASAQAAEMLEKNCDFFATVATPRDFMAVGQYYRRFPQVEDETVRQLLSQAESNQE